VLRRIFGLKRDEVRGEWRKLHNVELHYLYSLPSIVRIIKSRRIGLAGHVAQMGEKLNGYRLLVGKPEGKRPLGRPTRRWVDNIKMDLVEVRLVLVELLCEAFLILIVIFRIRNANILSNWKTYELILSVSFRYYSQHVMVKFNRM
jgi:hypothetical protein